MTVEEAGAFSKRRSKKPPKDHGFVTHAESNALCKLAGSANTALLSFFVFQLMPTILCLLFLFFFFFFPGSFANATDTALEQPIAR